MEIAGSEVYSKVQKVILVIIYSRLKLSDVLKTAQKLFSFVSG